MSSNIFLAYTNRGDTATLSGGSFESTLPLNNLKDGNISKVARTTSAAVTSTKFRADLGANYTLRALALVNANFTSAAQFEVRISANPIESIEFDFTTGAISSLLTCSGGANGTRVDETGEVVAATAPRFNYDPLTLARIGLLREEARTNLCLNSGDWSTTLFLASASTVTPAAGGLCTKRISFTASSSALTVKYNTAGNTTLQYPNTVRLKAGSFTSCTVAFRNAAQTISIQYTVNLTAVTLTDTSYGSPTSKITPTIKLVGGGEYEVTIGGVLNSGGGAETTGFYIFNPGSTAGTLDVGAGQIEVGAFGTSYIPTAGSTVTRSADSIALTGANFSSTNGVTAGTIYAEFNGPASGTRTVASLNDTTANEVVRLVTVGTDPKFQVIDGGSTVADIDAGTVAATTFYKLAGAYSAGDFAACLNGGTVGTDASGTLPTVTQLEIGTDLCGHIKRFCYWPARLTNAQLQSITTTGPFDPGYDSGWINALAMTFQSDTPSDWATKYMTHVAFDAISARYVAVSINDTANADGYVEIGRLFVGDGLQPEYDAIMGMRDGREDLSSSVQSVSGKQYSTARRRPRTVTMDLPALDAEEGAWVHEMQDAIGTTGEVLYLPNPDDRAKSQRYGFLGMLKELDALDAAFFEHQGAPIQLREKL